MKMLSNSAAESSAFSIVPELSTVSLTLLLLSMMIIAPTSCFAISWQALRISAVVSRSSSSLFIPSLNAGSPRGFAMRWKMDFRSL